jgi:hypothetical protein
LIRAGKLEVRPFLFFNLKGTLSQEEHKTIFSGLKSNKMALSDQIDFSAFSCHGKITIAAAFAP